jgi:hypothetical protein
VRRGVAGLRTVCEHSAHSVLAPVHTATAQLKPCEPPTRFEHDAKTIRIAFLTTPIHRTITSNSNLLSNIHLYAIIPYVSLPVRTTHPHLAGALTRFRSHPKIATLLSPLPAVLTNLRSRKSFACHSYKNTWSATPSSSNRPVCLTPPRCADSINLRPSQRFFWQTCQRITGGFHESRIF